MKGKKGREKEKSPAATSCSPARSPATRSAKKVAKKHRKEHVIFAVFGVFWSRRERGGREFEGDRGGGREGRSRTRLFFSVLSLFSSSVPLSISSLTLSLSLNSHARSLAKGRRRRIHSLALISFIIEEVRLQPHFGFLAWNLAAKASSCAWDSILPASPARASVASRRRRRRETTDARPSRGRAWMPVLPGKKLAASS